MNETTNNTFAGCTIVATGKLENFTRDGINAKIISLGATPGSSVTKKTDYLICGEKAGSKLAKAQQLGVKILTEQQFLEMLSAWEGIMGKNVDWIIHYILDDPGPYPYLCNAHTHGMEKYRHPDFQMVLNLPQKHICYLLNSMGMRVQGGETFHDGDMVSGIYEDCSIRLKKVHETGRDVLRLIIPDKHNRFPEDENCMEPYRHQELEMFEN